MTKNQVCEVLTKAGYRRLKGFNVYYLREGDVTDLPLGDATIQVFENRISINKTVNEVPYHEVRPLYKFPTAEKLFKDLKINSEEK